MMEPLDVVIRLGDAKKIGCRDTPSSKRPFEKTIGGRKHKFPKRKYEAMAEVEGSSSEKPNTPKSLSSGRNEFTQWTQLRRVYVSSAESRALW